MASRSQPSGAPKSAATNAQPSAPLSAENRKLLARFGGRLDRYGLGVVVLDCSEENINALLNAARANGIEKARAALAKTEPR